MCAKDYRLNDYSPSYEIESKKTNLRNLILDEHPRTSNYYSAVRREYKREFSDVYNKRCAYCGVPLGALPIDGFEVDHIVSKTAVADGTAEPIGGLNSLENLAFSCGVCNGRKGDCILGADCFEALCPDRGIGQTFVRDELYNLHVADEQNGVDSVLAFYNRMKFASDLRRVDYLLASLMDLERHVDEKRPLGEKLSREVCEKLQSASFVLLTKRNAISNELIIRGGAEAGTTAVARVE